MGLSEKSGSPFCILNMYYIEKIVDGGIKRKYLGQYEIPLKLEEKETRLYGFVNVMHMREIDRKRIDSRKVGIATEKCFEEVVKAINKILMKLFLPKTSSHNTFKYACSSSSICIHIVPSSDNKFLKISSRGRIN